MNVAGIIERQNIGENPYIRACHVPLEFQYFSEIRIEYGCRNEERWQGVTGVFWCGKKRVPPALEKHGINTVVVSKPRRGGGKNSDGIPRAAVSGMVQAGAKTSIELGARLPQLCSKQARKQDTNRRPPGLSRTYIACVTRRNDLGIVLATV